MLRFDSGLLGSRSGLAPLMFVPLTPEPDVPLVLAPPAPVPAVVPTLLSSTGALTGGAVLHAASAAAAMTAISNLCMENLRGDERVIRVGAGPRRARVR